ncbi:hypothetical protein L1987_21259 [Smallanthus sonchifolius]|uniref:Uncharacterized protein n=1 Tax=Smallanthus sonchifolius TaxID=185202 RepID=A0ACB9IW09_9ASTR|nr:hypothetical protein L1987_21259 [Smallanthus sonchifolius]
MNNKSSDLSEKLRSNSLLPMVSIFCSSKNRGTSIDDGVVSDRCNGVKKKKKNEEGNDQERESCSWILMMILTGKGNRQEGDEKRRG